MNFVQTDLQRELVEIAGRLADAFDRSADQHDKQASFPFENYDAIRAAAVPAWVLRELDGGRGAGVLDLCLALERLGRGDGSTALVVSMHLTHTARMLVDPNWPEPSRRQVCAAIAATGAMLNTAISEDATGSPSRGGLPETTATPGGVGPGASDPPPDTDGWTITGRKRFSTGAPVLTWFIINARTPDQQPARFLVPRDTPGLRIEETWDSLGMRATGSHDLVFDGAHLAPGGLLNIGQPPRKIDPWGLPVAAVYLGIGHAARDYAVDFARAWSPSSLGGRAIATVPHVQEQVGRMDMVLTTAEATLFAAAHAADEDAASPADMATAKSVATNAAVELTDVAMRIVGGHAISGHHPLQRRFRDVRAGLHHPPLDDLVLGLVGRSALGVQSST